MGSAIKTPGQEVPSPHTWGLSRQAVRSLKILRPFPTHVGVIPFRVRALPGLRPLPHTRGGYPAVIPALLGVHFPSPHTWGLSQFDDGREAVIFPFPTHVGVILRLSGSRDRAYPSPQKWGLSQSSWLSG